MGTPPHPLLGSLPGTRFLFSETVFPPGLSESPLASPKRFLRGVGRLQLSNNSKPLELIGGTGPLGIGAARMGERSSAWRS